MPNIIIKDGKRYKCRNGFIPPNPVTHQDGWFDGMYPFRIEMGFNHDLNHQLDCMNWFVKNDGTMNYGHGFDPEYDLVELIEEEELPLPIPVVEPVLFLFVSEADSKLRPGTKVVAATYGLVPFNSLEEAQEHCVRLRERQLNQNIFAYVRVE